ncbi:PLP-dependent aspartate aminotransferase family protein [Anaerolineales bacterium]
MVTTQGDQINKILDESDCAEQGSSTRAVHGGTLRKKAYSSLTTPIVQSATFTFQDTAELCEFMDAKCYGGELDREEYGRYGNPTLWAVEDRLAALDSAEDAALYPSGMSAVTSLLFGILSSGSHIIMTDDCYRRTRQFCLQYLGKFDIETTVVPMGDYEAMEAAIIPGRTRILISESPTNPYLRVADLEKFVQIAKNNKVLSLIDSTFATPINQRPLEWGVDFVLHSATKYLGGHNDVLGGVITGKKYHLKALKDSRGVFGGVMDAQSAYLIERGIKTLGVRVRQQNHSAQVVAEYLEAHPKIDRVWYPGLASHPDYEVAKSQMEAYGGVVSFEVVGDLNRTSQFIDACKIPYIAPSLGGVESLIEQPALVSFYEMTTEERLAVGIKDNLVRFALGIEDTVDIIADLEQALSKI